VDYLVELPATIGLSADEFVHLWNSHEELTEIAAARNVSQGAGNYDGGIFTIPIILGTVGVHIVASSIYDGLRRLFTQRGNGEAEFDMVERPDGTRMVHIRIKKG
jgi:hypothetical protein